MVDRSGLYERKYLHEFDPIELDNPALDRAIVTISVPEADETRPRTIPFSGLTSRKQIDKDFTAVDLTNGKIRIEHNFGKYCKTFVWDERASPVLPDEIISLDSIVVEVTLESFRLAGMITATTIWHLTITP